MISQNESKTSKLNIKFNGKRLKTARRYRGKTIIELAKEIEVTKQAVSQFENNINCPQFETLMKIIDVLGFPKEFYFEEDLINIEQGNTYFRASSKMSKKEEYIENEKSKMIGQLFSFLEEYIEFPQLNLPTLNYELTIEEKANKLREFWGLGEEPVKDVIHVLEKNGIIVTSMNDSSEHMDAYTQLQSINGKKYFVVVLGNDKGSCTRRQFSAAHELAHIILHDSYMDLDELSPDEIRNIEKEAHTFASAFLLPEKSFGMDVSMYATNLDYYIKLKKKWKTSISAMVMRASHIGLLSYQSYQTMFRKMNKMGWKSKEPLDDTLMINEPTLLKRAINILIDNDVFTEREIMYELSKRNISLPSEEVELLLGLDKGTLSYTSEDVTNKIIDISIKNTRNVNIK